MTHPVRSGGVLTAAALAACGLLPRDAAFQVQHPLAGARVWSNELYVRLAPDVALIEVVAVPIAPLVPGTSLAEASRSLGAPVATTADVQCKYYRFLASPPNVDLAYCSGPGSDGETWESWDVVAQPPDSRLAVVLREPLLAVIRRAEPVDELVVHESDRKPGGPYAFSADIKDGMAHHLRWYGPLKLAAEAP